ncbi:hypothetical protein HPB50_019836 [Hyalomma asiaticum]|uniref:Uncharacterized protein n=1 Tax=Hyalomma asiaticum TaxID=266040 RepID=A0ACB7RVD2_HYAAI|nr:hypothetical protein HPB50_019836 [Hyalomma asiaticum]
MSSTCAAYGSPPEEFRAGTFIFPLPIDEKRSSGPGSLDQFFAYESFAALRRRRRCTPRVGVMSQVGVGDEDDLSPEEMLKWRQTHIYDAAYQDSLRKDAIAAAVWQQMVSRSNKLLSTAAGFPATMKLRQDITVNPTTNTVTLSTESYERLTKYLAIKSLMVNGQKHEVTSYSVLNSETCKGIIHIGRVCLGEVISEKDIVPMLLEDMKLDPFNVRYDISQNYQSPRSTRLPPTPNTKPPLQTKKQGPLPKENQEE